MPQTVLCRGVGVASLPVEEKDGLVWVWPGWEAPGEVPGFAMPPAGFTIHSQLEMEVGRAGRGWVVGGRAGSSALCCAVLCCAVRPGGWLWLVRVALGEDGG